MECDMKKWMILAICVMVAMVSCKNKGQTTEGEGADSDSVAIDSVLAELPDTAPRPMFLYMPDKNHMQVLYWAGIEKPNKDDCGEEYYADVLK
jgi:hypothetical protein